MLYLPKSAPIHLRPNFSATAKVVPEPQKKSATIESILDDAFIILSNKASGFCVGYPTSSFLHPDTLDISAHHDSGILPKSWRSLCSSSS